MGKCHELKRQMLVLPQALCCDSKYHSLPAPKLTGNFEKILAKKKGCYSCVITSLYFMLVLLHITLYSMYSISSFCKIQNITIRFQILVKLLRERIEGWIVWFSFGFNFMGHMGGCFLCHHCFY